MIRPAKIEDAAVLLAIYAKYMDTPITFELEAPPLAEFENRIKTISAAYPYQVYEEENGIGGYAYAHTFRERAAYAKSAELSIYLAPERAGQGIGSQLYGKLIRQLAERGFHTLIGCVTLPNPASEALHRKMGFTLTGRIPDAGFKIGKWHSIGYFCRTLTFLSGRKEK